MLIRICLFLDTLQAIIQTKIIILNNLNSSKSFILVYTFLHIFFNNPTTLDSKLFQDKLFNIRRRRAHFEVSMFFINVENIFPH